MAAAGTLDTGSGSITLSGGRLSGLAPACGLSEKTGLPAKGFGTGQSTDDAKAIHIGSLDNFRAYQQKVGELAFAFLDSLDEAGLQREVKLGEKTETIGESINLHLVIHLNGHRGEVNLLRGMQGFDPVLLNQGG